MSMHTTTFHGPIPADTTTRPSLVRRIFTAMIRARERQARRYVDSYLLDLDDRTLKSYGIDRSELAGSRSGVRPL